MTYTSDIIQWQGLKIEIRYCENRFKIAKDPDAYISHIEVRAIEPARGPLPITETGYKSDYVHPEQVLACGGVSQYVLAWLDHDAKSDQWKIQKEQARQLSLF